ncbi:hypothetical protein LJB99_00545 [Deltaproteobacteria bacterium OttesenSCG-928-K17]|nr:hypothetical protein [Deltaproteobacteria bacterium OttesenSCG-928-K17]
MLNSRPQKDNAAPPAGGGLSGAAGKEPHRPAAGLKTGKVTAVLSGTADYAFAIGNVLIGLERHSPGFVDEVIIFHQGFAENDRRALSAIRPCVFKEYKAEGLSGYVESDHFHRVTTATFATFEIFELLRDSRFLIYLDADILIQDDISGILEYAAPIGMRLISKDKPGVLEEQLGANHEGRPLPDYEGNAGIIVISDEILPRAEGLKELLYQKAVEYSPTNKRGDQTIFNLGLFLRGIEICGLPIEYNQPGLYIPFNPHARILHQVYLEKFWNNGLVNFLAPEWNENYKIWLEAGGTPYQGDKRLWEFTGFAEAPLFKLTAMAKIYRRAISEHLARLGRMCRPDGADFVVDGYRLFMPQPNVLNDGGFGCETLMFDKDVTIALKAGHPALVERLAAFSPAAVAGFTFQPDEKALVWRERFTEDAFSSEKTAEHAAIVKRALDLASEIARGDRS